MTVRRPGWDDLPAVLELARAADVAVIGDSDWIEEDLRAEWRELDLERDAWLVERDGELAGYATFAATGGRLRADGYVHPRHRGRGVGTELLRLTEERAAAEAERVPAPERVYLQNATLLGDGDRCTPRLYERGGYAPVRHFWRLVAHLDTLPETEPRPLPPGVELVPYDHPHDAEAVHAAYEEAFRDHWEHRPTPFDEWARRRFGDQRFDPSLWLLARAGDELAGFALNAWKTGGDWGWVDALGVRPAWRRRGIAEALLHAAFAEFRRRGETRVALGVDAQSPTGATRLYERAGMRVFWRAVVWEKELRPGA